MGKIFNRQSYKLLQKNFMVKAIFITIASFMVMLPFASGAIEKQAPESFSEIVKNASPAVVYISTKTIVKDRFFSSPYGQNDPMRDFFEQFFGNRIPRDIPQNGLGTGFIIDKDGYILTNNHVVEKADEIKVTLENEKEFQAKIIGRDPETDVALIKIDGAQNLKPLGLGNSDALEVGDWVVAIGNPYGLGHTVTHGIVSAKYRNNVMGGTFDNFIQTDASINPGNSGGPLMNLRGEVIGINSAIYSQTGGSVGIGFAIPINMAKDILPMLKTGKIERGYLGVGVQDIDPDLKTKFNLENEKGALINRLFPGGPSEEAGLKIGDVIVEFQGKEIKDREELIRLVSSTPVGTKADVVVIRKGKKVKFQVKLAQRPGTDEEAVMDQPTKMNLGLELDTLTPEKARRYGISETEGLVVLEVEYNSAAAEAGLMSGDLILEVEQEKVKTVEEFNKILKGYKPGEKILLLIKRRDATIFITLKIGND